MNFTFTGVMGPDEDHWNVTDNVYTNVVFKIALKFARFVIYTINTLTYVHMCRFVKINIKFVQFLCQESGKNAFSRICNRNTSICSKTEYLFLLNLTYTIIVYFKKGTSLKHTIHMYISTIFCQFFLSTCKQIVYYL